MHSDSMSGIELSSVFPTHNFPESLTGRPGTWRRLDLEEASCELKISRNNSPTPLFDSKSGRSPPSQGGIPRSPNTLEDVPPPPKFPICSFLEAKLRRC